MEGRPPFDEDELDFDFGSARRQHERDTGERPVTSGAPEEGTGESTLDTGESPYDTGERPAEQGDTTSDTGEGTGGSAYDTGESSYGTGERTYGTGESPTTGEDPFDTGERRARRRERPKRRLRIGRRRSRDRRQRPAAEDAAAAAPTGTETGERRLRDDPYTPAVVPVPGERRSRHRDLPAKVRRRQAGLAGGVALLVVIGLVLLARAVFGGGDDEGEQPLGLKRLAGQSIIGKLSRDGPDRQLLQQVRKGRIGGVIVAAADEEALTQQVSQLQSVAADGGNPELLVLIDQEGGEVKRLPGPPDTPPQELGEAGADAARSEGEATGNYLKGAGVNVDLAPVLDVELPQTADTIASRTFSDDPAVVSEVGTAFIEGMQGTGIAATAKHFPGMGPATVNTDFAPTTIAARDETLAAALEPFQAAVDAGVKLVMVSSATYPNYGPESPSDPSKPASSVKAIVTGLLRDQLGFEGVIITDDLQSTAILTLGSSSAAGVAALGAGCDLLLYGGNLAGTRQGLAAVVKAVKQDKLSRDQIQASYDRITALKTLLSASSD
jgi:beta-N-acetylhexosaminidase